MRFDCTVLGCSCAEVIIAAQVIARADGTPFYEHTRRGPNCLHLLSKYKWVEQPPERAHEAR